MRQRLNLSIVLVVAGFIAHQSLVPYPATSGGGKPPSSLVLHVAAYLVLAASLAVYLQGTRRHGLNAVWVAAVFGLSLELVQGNLPTRHYSAVDVAANSLGASVVLLDHRLRIAKRIVELEDRIIESVTRKHF